MTNVEIVLYDSPVAKIPDALTEALPQLRPLLDHFREANRSEHFVRNQQLAMLKDGAIELPSLFASGADRCDCSFFVSHHFFFQFLGREEYFWITAPLDRGYCFATIYIPSMCAAVSLYPFAVDAGLLERFEDLRRQCKKPDRGVPTVITGFSQYLHTLWNEMSALDYAAKSGLLEGVSVYATFEPFGPTDAIFPEIKPASKRLSHGDILKTNDSARFLVGLGGWTISRSAQARLQDMARYLASPLAKTASLHFKNNHEPVFWLSIKPPRRTLTNQAEVLSKVITALLKAFPRAGVLLNGASLPWDTKFNPNYGNFAQGIESIHEFVDNVYLDILSSLATESRKQTKLISGVSVADEMIWSSIVDFYICHGGSMQNKIGWVYDVPGYIHSNIKFIEVFRRMRPVENGPEIFFVRPEIIRDCPAEDYTSFEIARKDQDYTVIDLSAFVEDIISAIEQSGLKKSKI